MAKPGRPAKFTRTTAQGRRELLPGYVRVHAFVKGDTIRKLKIVAAKKGKPFTEVLGDALAAYVKRFKV